MSLRLLVDTVGDRKVDQFLGQWVQARIPRCQPFRGEFRGLGVCRGDHIVAAAIYSDLCLWEGGGNVYISFAADAPVVKQGPAQDRAHAGIRAPHWATRQTVGYILGLPFHQMGVTRITALIDRSFTASRQLVIDCGFKQEGVARQILPRSRDAVIYGLLKDEFLGGRFGPKRAPTPAPALSQAA